MEISIADHMRATVARYIRDGVAPEKAHRMAVDDAAELMIRERKGDVLRVSDVAHQFGVARKTVHRWLSSMGFKPDRVTKRYHLSEYVVELMRRVYVREISARKRESVSA